MALTHDVSIGNRSSSSCAVGMLLSIPINGKRSIMGQNIKSNVLGWEPGTEERRAKYGFCLKYLTGNLTRDFFQKGIENVKIRVVIFVRRKRIMLVACGTFYGAECHPILIEISAKFTWAVSTTHWVCRDLDSYAIRVRHRWCFEFDMRIASITLKL